ncbi:hypothetical protein [Bacillus toyonensis]|uniref:hypothetical protein n=1 Tax=Bacillus toyonensis TaxID=155322 RepID=UPI002E1A42A5|nr:hypothetical protein [Bacillus toyonensis]
MEKINEVLNKYGIRSKKPFSKKIKMDIQRALLLYKVTDLNKRVVKTVAQRKHYIESWLISQVINRANGLCIDNISKYLSGFQIVSEKDKTAMKMILGSLELRYDHEKEKLFFNFVISYKLINELSNAQEMCVPILGQAAPSFVLRAAFTGKDQMELLFQEAISTHLLGILNTSGFLNEFKESAKNTFVI